MSGDTSGTTATETTGTGKKRPLLKLAAMVVVPLIVLGGGGYAGWTMFLASPGDAAHGEAAAEGHGDGADGAHGGAAPDQIHVAAVDYSIAAETSFTYTQALSEMLADMCGQEHAPDLKAAAEDEAHTDGMLVHMSWIAAYRRMGSVTKKSCHLMRAEVINANGRAFARAEEEAVAAAPKAAH